MLRQPTAKDSAYLARLLAAYKAVQVTPAESRLLCACGRGEKVGVDSAPLNKLAIPWARYNSVHFEERKSDLLAPKRHRMKHLDLDLPLVRDQGVGGSNPLSPTNFSLARSTTTQLLLSSLCAAFSVHSVQLIPRTAVRSRFRTARPSSF